MGPGEGTHDTTTPETDGDNVPDVLAFLCYLVAFVCFAAAALWHDRPTRVNLVAVGLAAWVLVPLTAAWPN